MAENDKNRHNIKKYIQEVTLWKVWIGIPLTAEETEFQDFLQWIRQKFNVETGQLWSSILLFHSADEKSAVDRFFTLFEEFSQQQKNHETAKINEVVSSSW